MILSRNEGFTLIEVVVVIAIIGILVTIAIPQFSKYRIMSHNAAALADLKNAITAQEAYFADNKKYAESIDRLTLTYDLIKSPGVILVTGGDESVYTISSHHPNGNKTYMYTGPGGTITSD